MEKTKKTVLPKSVQGEKAEVNDTTANLKENEDTGYVKQIFTEQDVYTSGVIYRYINNVDPNKDLITDTAKIGGPLNIITVPDK